MIRDLCAATRADLMLLGQTGGPVVEALAALSVGAGDQPDDAVADPAFALDVRLVPDAAWPGGSSSSSGRGRRGPTASCGPRVTVAAAVEGYEQGALSLIALASQRTYRTWTRRLVAEGLQRGWSV